MSPRILPYRMHGATVVEFALVAALLMTLLFGIIEMGRLMFYWNTATELTRLGARTAVVCNVDTSAIRARMTRLYPLIPPDKVLVDYLPAGCSSNNSCTEVSVKVAANVTIQTYIPFIPLTLALPEFRTTLPRESLRSNIDGVPNPICQ